MRKQPKVSKDNQRAAFSLKDARLLADCLPGLQALDWGTRIPQTAAQERFVQVCRGKLPAQTPHEKAYVAWRARKPNVRAMLDQAERAERRLVDLIGKLQQSVRREDPKNSDRIIAEEKARQKRVAERRATESPKSDFKPRYVEETWGNREAWKRDRAKNKFNGR